MFKLLILFVFIASTTFAFLVSDDEDYFIYRTSKVNYILTESDFKYFETLLVRSHQFISLYEREFHWILDEKLSFTVASNRNQIANAFASNIPFNMVVFQKGGVEFLDPSASNSWINTLSSHEIAHVYQLNPKSPTGKNLKKIFGNQSHILIPFIPIPIFISPSVLLPTFIVEGNATFNESRVNQGGRLLSGDSLMFTTELIESGLADLKYVMNMNHGYPFGKEKYVVGGYFQSFLAGKYDFNQVNKFFLNHSHNNIHPFDLKYSFASTFFADYEDLYSGFISDFKEKQKDYVKYRGDSIATSLFEIQFKRIGDSVYFLSSPEGLRSNWLNRFQFGSNSLSSTPSHLGGKKVFNYNGKFQTTNSYSENDKNVYYALLDEDYNVENGFKGKFVTDIEGAHVSYFEMSESFDIGSLYLNGKKIADTESKAVLDPEGNIYYFKQIGNLKTLFKNETSIASFESNYALLTDVINDQEIYFVSNSKNGSGLFCFCQNQFERITRFDNVSSAAKAGDGFLFSFLSRDQYSVVYLANPERKPESPYYVANSLPASYFSPAPQIETPSFEKPISYLSLRELRFYQYTFDYIQSEKHHTLINSLSWIDPLMFFPVSASFSLSDQLSFNAFRIEYLPYSVKFGLLLRNETDYNWNETRKKTENSGEAELRYVLYDKRFHSVNLGLNYRNEKNEYFKNEISTLFLNYQYAQMYFMNYLPNTFLSITPSVEQSSGKTSQSVTISGTKMLWDNFYASVNYARDNSEYFKLSSSHDKHLFFKRGIPIPLSFTALYTEKVVQSEIEFLYEIPYSKYFYRFPISLRRTAPFLSYQKVSSEEKFQNTELDEFSFATVGIETELLLFHLQASRLRLFSTEFSYNEKSETRMGLELKSYF